MSPKSGKGVPQATWKDPRRRPELLKAIGAGTAIVLLTALTIFLVKPDDPASTTPTPAPIQTPIPSDTTGSLPTDTTPTLPTDPSSSTTPGDTTGTTVPTESSTIPTQP